VPATTRFRHSLGGRMLVFGVLPTDLILLDLMMPVMDGFEFLAELRTHAEWRKLPVIVVSAKHLIPEEQEFLEDATRRVVTKGSDAGQSLLSALEKVVEAAPS